MYELSIDLMSLLRLSNCQLFNKLDFITLNGAYKARSPTIQLALSVLAYVLHTLLTM